MKLIALLAVLGLATLTYCWFQALAHNLSPWVEAGRQMTGMRNQLAEAVRSLAPGKSLALVDLPQDFQGAGLLGKNELLDVMLSKPIADADYASRLVTLERPIPGPRQFICPDLLARVSGDRRTGRTIYWSNNSNCYETWERPNGARTLDVTLPQPITVDELQTPVTLWLVHHQIDPLAVAWVEVAIEGEPADRLDKIASEMHLVWRSKNQPRSWIDYTEGPIPEWKNGKLLFVPARLRSWAVNGNIMELGMTFPRGNYRLTVSGIKGGAASLLMPSLQVVSTRTGVNLSGASGKIENPAGRFLGREHHGRPGDLRDLVMPAVGTGDGVMVIFDASGIPLAAGVDIAITAADASFPDPPATELPGDPRLLLARRIKSASGQLCLPKEALGEAGKHQLAVLAIDARDKPVGYLSEPRTYLVNP